MSSYLGKECQQRPQSVKEYVRMISSRYDVKPNEENLCCTSCVGVFPVCYVNPRYPNWCLSLVCGCRRKWHCCRFCDSYGKLYKASQLLAHDQLHQVQDDDSSDCDDGACLPTVANHEDYDLKDKLSALFADNQHWVEFFLHHRKGSSLRFLVSQQFSDCLGEADISDEDAELHMLIATHAHHLTKGEKFQFAEILRRIFQMEKKERVSGELRLPIPTTSLELNRYLDGKRAIVSNIPVPEVHMAENGDAYVRLRDVIQLYYSFRLHATTVRQINETGPVGREKVSNNIWQTNQAQKRLQSLPERTNSTVKIALMRWSDGCDANNNKNNRGSMHVGTVTVYSEKKSNSADNTFVLHVGREDCDHHEVTAKMLEDLQELELPNVLYNGQDFDKTQFTELASICDRPEKSKMCGYGSHNGTYTMRYPWSSPVPENLASCETCFERRKRCITSWKSNSSCPDCFDWDFEEILFEAPKDFPEEETDEDGYLKARLLTFEDMKEAAEKTHNMLVSKRWTKAAAVSYLRAMAMNSNTATRIINNAKSEEPLTVDSMVPPVWLVADRTERYIEAVMHMLFLGVTKTIGMMLRDLLSLYSRWSNFHKATQPYLRQLRNYSLHYCRIWTFGSHEKPFSPWQSENHLAYARCFKMAGSNLTVLLGGRNEEERQKAVSAAKTTINTWAACISRLMAKPNSKDNSNSAERHIKLFLSAVNDLDEIIMDKKNRKEGAKQQENRKIQTVSNFVGMLNLPKQMREYGNLRDYWEGSYRGERILQQLKPLVSQGTYHPWFASSVLKRFYERKTMSLLMADNNNQETEDTDEKGNNYTMYYRYERQNTVEQLLHDGMPLSGVILNDGKIMVAFGRNRLLKFLEIVPNDNIGINLDRTFYSPLSLGNVVAEDKDVESLKDQIEDFVLMLPHLDPSAATTTTAATEIDDENDARDEHYYLIVDTKWKERVCHEGSTYFILPRLDNVNY